METSVNDVFRALNGLTTFLTHTAGRAQLMCSPLAQEIRSEWQTHDKLWHDYNGLRCSAMVNEAQLRQLAAETLNFCSRMIELNLKLNH